MGIQIRSSLSRGAAACCLALIHVSASSAVAQEPTPTPAPYDALLLSYQATAGIWVIAGLICTAIVMNRVRV